MLFVKNNHDRFTLVKYGCDRKLCWSVVVTIALCVGQRKTRSQTLLVNFCHDRPLVRDLVVSASITRQGPAYFSVVIVSVHLANNHSKTDTSRVQYLLHCHIIKLRSLDLLTNTVYSIFIGNTPTLPSKQIRPVIPRSISSRFAVL